MRGFRLLLACLGFLLLAGGASAQNRFWLVNDTGQPIEAAHVAAARVTGWGPDILGGTAIAPGQRVWVTPLFSDCTLSVRVLLPGGTERIQRDINACRRSEVAFAREEPARDPSFTFVNQSGRTMRELYVSPSTDEEWGKDRLGNEVLRNGQQVAIEMPRGPGCATDMLVVFMDDTRAERRRVETCGVGRYQWR